MSQSVYGRLGSKRIILVALMLLLIGVFILRPYYSESGSSGKQSFVNDTSSKLPQSEQSAGVGSQNKNVLVFEGFSMLPNIRDGQQIVIERFDQTTEYEIKRGDIVALWLPQEPYKAAVKRVIGLPGDIVEIKNGAVVVNGRRLSETYVYFNKSERSAPATHVSPHHYYVLGDNRDNSSDSRLWGLVPQKHIFGRATMVYLDIRSLLLNS